MFSFPVKRALRNDRLQAELPVNLQMHFPTIDPFGRTILVYKNKCSDNVLLF